MNRIHVSPLIVRSPSILIASGEAPQTIKDVADYICDGTADQVQINAAIQDLNSAGTVSIKNVLENTTENQGGKVLLTGGAFNINGKIDAHGIDNLTIEGQGPSTVINNQATDGSHAIEAINVAATTFPTIQGQNRLTIKNILVQGNSDSGDGIHLEETNYEKIQNVFAQGNGGHGIYIKALTENGGASNKILSNCQTQFNDLSGLYLEAVHETLITNLHSEENDRYGVEIKDSVDIKLTGCNIEDNYGTYQIYGTNIGDLALTGSVVEGDTYITCENGGSNYITGNEMGKLYLIVETIGFFHLSNNHTGELNLTGTAGAHFYINNSYTSLLTINAGASSKVYISNLEAANIDNISATTLHITNSTIPIGTANKSIIANIVKISNTQIDTSQNFTLTISDTLNMNGTTIRSISGTPTITLGLADSSSVLAQCTGIHIHGVNLAITGYSNQNHQVILNGSNFRLLGATITITNANANLNGNEISGTGTLAFVGCNSININGNTFVSSIAMPLTITFDANCISPMLLATNTITDPSHFTLIDSSTNLIKKSNVGVADS